VAENLRLLSHGLHPSVLQHIGLVAALQAHCAEVERQHHLLVRFFAEGEVEPSSRLVALSLFRITQEALRNAVRHGHARHAAVSLARDGMDLKLAVADDGEGFDLAAARQNGGLGLMSIEERARLVKGQVTVSSRMGDGTTVDVRVPMGVTDYPWERKVRATDKGRHPSRPKVLNHN
jgi:signal transduction histidine kinase